MKSIKGTIQVWILGIALASLFSATSSFADPYFQSTRIDAFVPANCRNLELRNFNLLGRYITYSVQGACAAGFTHEYPISRQDAQNLWKTLRTEALTNTHKLSGNTATLYTAGRQMGFNFEKEGDVLEVLALLQLKQEYPEREYFLTGGLAYGYTGGAYLGEIDIIVARRSDCDVVAVGESKLGVNERSHALQQLKRFSVFLREKLCSRGEQAPVCK